MSMMVRDTDNPEDRYSRYPMTLGDAVAALFRARPRRMASAMEQATADTGGLERLGAKQPSGGHSDPERLPAPGRQNLTA